MGDTKRRIDISIGSSYDGSGVKLAAADLQKLREQANLPTMGPLGKADSLKEQAAIEQKMVQDLVQRRAAAMEAAAVKHRVQERAEEALFGKAKKPLLDEESIKMIEAFRNRVRETRGEAGGLLEVFKKFGTSGGTDAIVEKFSKVAPMIGVVLAASKVASMGLQFLNFREDVARHNSQNNLERQLADEQAANAWKEGVPVFGPLAKHAADYFNLGNYHSDKVAIENVEDATRAQDQHTEAMRRRLDLEKQLRESSKANVEALQLEFAKRSVTPERGAVLDAQANLAKLRQQIYDAGGKIDPKKIAELQEELTLRQKAVDLAMQDEAKAHARTMANLDAESYATRLDLLDKHDEAERERRRQAMEDALQDIKDGNQREAQARLNGLKLQQLTKVQEEARQKALDDLRADTRDARLRTGGFGFTADMAKIKQQYVDSLIGDSDPRSLMAKFQKALADQAARRKQAKDEADQSDRDHETRMREGAEDILSRRLRGSGAGVDADRFDILRSYRSDIEQIRDQARKAIEADGERAGEIRRQAMGEMMLRTARNQQEIEDLDARLADKFRIQPNALPEGDTRMLHGILGPVERSQQDQQLDMARRRTTAVEDTRTLTSQMLAEIQGLRDDLRGQDTPQPILTDYSLY